MEKWEVLDLKCHYKASHGVPTHTETKEIQGHHFLQDMLDTDRERTNRSLNKKQRKMSLVDWENARLASSPREASDRAHP